MEYPIFPTTEKEKNWKRVLTEAFFMSWLAMFAIGTYLGIMFSNGSKIVAGGMALLAILLAMNGLARSELWWTSRGPKWWKSHPLLHKIHHITAEGEMAGIIIGFLIIATHVFLEGSSYHPHFPWAESFTLLGIMSLANTTATHILPIMEMIARRTGTFGVVFFGSLLSSLTGEPAAAVFLSRYVSETVPEEQRPLVATGLAATIGSGGGLLPTAAPPILIVWYPFLKGQLQWSLGTLFLMVGIGCILHVGLTTLKVRHLLRNPAESDTITYEATKATWLSLAGISIIVLINMLFPHHVETWILDGIVGLGCIVYAIRHKLNFQETWQPLVLAVLLIALEVVGHEADPLLKEVAALIPANWNILVIGFALWAITTVTSHFADNALASRVFMTAAITLGHANGGITSASFLAACVVLGALFGGFALIPANLPNFAISKILNVGPGAWARTAVPAYYYTGIAHIVFIIGLYIVVL